MNSTNRGILDVVTINFDASEIDVIPGWRLFAADGFVGEVGDTGDIVGTEANQDIEVREAGGSFDFDASFNKGGDIIRLHRDASDWQVEVSGSSAIFSREESIVTIPLGTAGATIAFDDGARTLRYDPEAAIARIGDQPISSTPTGVLAEPTGPVPPVVEDSGLGGRLFVFEGESVRAGGQLSVVGTDAAEHVRISYGTVQFDASFNKGGDRIRLDGDIDELTAVRSGSSVHIEGGDLSIFIPVGPTSSLIVFQDNVELELLYDPLAKSIVLGDFQIGTSPIIIGDFA